MFRPVAGNRVVELYDLPNEVYDAGGYDSPSRIRGAGPATGEISACARILS